MVSFVLYHFIVAASSALLHKFTCFGWGGNTAYFDPLAFTFALSLDSTKRVA
jgi:hypothetical protein